MREFTEQELVRRKKAEDLRTKGLDCITLFISAFDSKYISE